MADGQVLIDSKLDTKGVTKGADKIEKEFDQLAKITKKTAQIMEQQLKNVDLDGLADGMSDSFETEGKQVEQSVEQTADTVERSAEKMADAMEESADDQTDSMRKAWDKTEDEAQSGSRKVIDDIDDIGDEAKETGREIESSLSSAFSGLAGKIGGIMATAFAFDEIVEFGKEAVELGSALSEVQNVVDVTFGDASGSINEFSRNAIKQFGLSELSAKQFTSTIGAMLKSMGDFDQAELVEMSTALAGLAGDMASFYNLDAQEAFDKLRAGISGETEPLKQLGINLSVANLEAFALANGITKTYDKMTEQEKALLRYNYLLSATADAQGDFARTQDSWANQTRILTEEFNSLKGTLGQGLINVLNPIVTAINGTFMPVLQNLADKFLELTETFDWNDLIGDVDFGPIVASLGDFSAKCSELASVIGSGLKWAWDNVLVPLGSWAIDAGIPATLDALGAAFGALASAIEWLSPLASAIWNDFLQPIAAWVGDAVVGTLNALADAFNFLSDAFSTNAIDSVTWFSESMVRAGNYAQTGMIEPIMTGLDEVSYKSKETSENLTENMQKAATAAGTAGVATVETTVSAMHEITDAEQASILETSEAVVAGNKKLVDGVVTNTATANEAISADATNAGNQIANSYTDAANRVTTTAFEPIEESGTATAEATSEAFDDAANTLKTAWADMGTWFDANVATPIKSSIESVSVTMRSKWEEMKSDTAAAWAEMVAIVESSVLEIQSSINSIKGKTVYVNVEKTGSGASMISYSGYDGKAYSPEMGYEPATAAYTPATLDYSPATYRKPYLATGAVIPPMAISSVSARYSGMNTEDMNSLADKIASAVAVSVGTIDVNNTVRFEGTLAQLGRVLKPVIDTETRRRGTSLAKEGLE